MILIIDYGSQYTLLIQKILEQLRVESSFFYPKKDSNLLNKINILKPSGIVFSGGPKDVIANEHPEEMDLLKNTKIPVLGICFGFQLMVYYLEGKIVKDHNSEFGKVTVHLTNSNSQLFKNINSSFTAWMSHSNGIVIPKSKERLITITSRSENDLISSFEFKDQPIFGLQFHPEVEHTEHGEEILKNFVFNICKEEKSIDNSISILFDKKRSEVLSLVKENKVALALSGGTDSTILGVFLNKILKRKQLHCFFVDNGLLRKNELQEAKKLFYDLKLPVKYINAKNTFLKNLKNVKDPERKRKIIGKTFIQVFEKSLEKEKIDYFAQGTIHSDVVESSSEADNKLQKKIKSHHNVGGLPKKLKFKLVEPFSSCFKDEVRKLGLFLGLNPEFLQKHPFPGPGLGVRIIGDITPKKVKILQEADFILNEILKEENIYHKISQGFAVLLSDKTTGVKGDNRFYGYILAIRLVTTKSFMTAEAYEIDFAVLKKITNQILNKISEICRIVYDSTSKPPATIEWE